MASQFTKAGAFEAEDVRLSCNVAHKKENKTVDSPKRAGIVLIFCVLLSVSFAPVEVRGEKAAIGDALESKALRDVMNVIELFEKNTAALKELAAQGKSSAVQTMGRPRRRRINCNPTLDECVELRFRVCQAHRFLRRHGGDVEVTEEAVVFLAGAVEGLTYRITLFAGLVAGSESAITTGDLNATIVVQNSDILQDLLAEDSPCSYRGVKRFQKFIHKFITQGPVWLAIKWTEIAG
eukprot:498363_1